MEFAAARLLECDKFGRLYEVMLETTAVYVSWVAATGEWRVYAASGRRIIESHGTAKLAVKTVRATMDMTQS